MTYFCHQHCTQTTLLRKPTGQTSHLTSAPNTALRTQPLPLRNGLGGFSYAAHVVCSRAAITAQQAAPQATKHTQVCVAVILKQLRGCSWCFFFTVIIISLQSTHRSVLPSSSNSSGAAAGASSSLSSSFPCKARTDLCCRHPQTAQGLQLVLLLHCHHHFPAKHTQICVAVMLK